MIETLEHIDRSIFFAINGHHSRFLDVVMDCISSVMIWIPFYALMAWLLYKSLGNKIVMALLCAGFMVLCADQSANLIKNSIKRYRPSHNLELTAKIHLVNDYKGGQYGFVSGHAANTFALAFFLVFLFRDKKNWFRLLILFWACLVSYSRIYLGVHYPSDIAGGALLGGFWAYVFSLIYKKLEKAKS